MRGNNRGGKAIIQGRTWRQLWPHSTKVESVPLQQSRWPDRLSRAPRPSLTVPLHSFRALMTSHYTEKKITVLSFSLLQADLSPPFTHTPTETSLLPPWGLCVGCSLSLHCCSQFFRWLTFSSFRSQLKPHLLKRPSRTFSSKQQSVLQLHGPCFLFTAHLKHLCPAVCLHTLLYFFCLVLLDVSTIQTGDLTRA